MSRLPRVIDPEGGIYHVICRGNNKAFIFNDDIDRSAFREVLVRYMQETAFKLYHYVIMGNHVHMVIAPLGSWKLADIMQRINQAYALSYKRRHGYVGQLWQGRFKSFLIKDDEYLLTCGIYVELNPVRANIALLPESYRWSSYRFYAQGEQDVLLTCDPLYETLGQNADERRLAYRAMTRMGVLQGKGVPGPA